jgi:tetratricopeptide (TPR) repeat protein
MGQARVPARSLLRPLLGAMAACLLAALLLPCSVHARDSSPADSQTEPPEPGSALSALTTAAWLFHNGHPEAAQAALGEYLQREPTSIQVRLEYGRMLAFAQHYPQAMQQFQLVLRSEPSNLAAQVGLAKVHSWQNRFSVALELYDQVLARAPGHYDATVGKAFTLLWMGRRHDAVPLFQAAARRNPQDKEVAAVMKRLGLRSVPQSAARAADNLPAARTEARARAASTPTSEVPAAQAESLEAPLPASAAPPSRTALQAAIAAPAAGVILLAGALLVYRRRERIRRIPLRAQRKRLRLPAASTAHRGRHHPPGPLPLRDARFLAVEPDPDQLHFIETALTAAGAEVVCCRSATEAARQAAGHSFDVLVLDAAMQGEWTAADLWEWLLRTHPAGTRSLILIVDPAAGAQTQKLAAESGAVCLARPFTARDLTIMARLALGRNRATRRGQPA